MNNIQLKSASFEVSSDAEIIEATKSTSHSFGDLKDAIDCLHGRISEAGFHESHDSIPVRLESLR